MHIEANLLMIWEIFFAAVDTIPQSASVSIPVLLHHNCTKGPAILDESPGGSKAPDKIDGLVLDFRSIDLAESKIPRQDLRSSCW